MILFLVLFPLATAFILCILPNNLRNFLTKVASLALVAVSIYFLALYFSSPPVYFNFSSELINYGMLLIEVALALYVFIAGIKHKKYLASLLMVLQAGLMVYFDLTYGHHLEVENALFFDQLTTIMIAIIGVVGSLICYYAAGYMDEYHHEHPEVKDRKKLFFFILFAFLSAMFGIVLSNNLLWLYFFWEITTICSFVLIGYSQTEEAINNSFRALIMNLLGGLAFASAIVYLYLNSGIIELDKLISLSPEYALIPAVLISFAGLTKSAQLPFSSWLLGAMVAPTPVSALLHSSTMVKAGVYIIIKLAPILQGTVVGLIVALVGAVTFLLTSCIAISQSTAKRVLAYSTISNLGLIVTCAAIGTNETVWAAVFLVVFHAIAKALLFLCCGTVDQKIDSRDIEGMDGLIVSMPKIAVLMMIGIAGMFLAPFGMLVSKWAAMEALVKIQPIFALFLAFGSATTLFFWIKWMGKLIAVTEAPKKVVNHIEGAQWMPLLVLGLMTIAICFLFPVMSSSMVEPYVALVYGSSITLTKTTVAIISVMMGLVVLLPLKMLSYGKSFRKVDTYLGGANVPDKTQFNGVMGTKTYEIRNYYLEQYFGEGKLYKFGVIISSLLIIVMFGVEVL
ncbi:proton-conducting transporter membrane subunit [Bacillota bacterium LX-D]|nr:proton-conducting transporter membrane subunit [Bacillota bacterium LX-D]